MTKPYCGFNARNILNYTKANLLLKVFAEGGEPPKTDEPPATPPATPPTPTINYEDLIAKARKEEKDKLYPKITALETEKKDLIEKSNQALLKIGTLETELDMLKKQSGGSESETVKQLKADLAQAKADLEKLQKEKVDPTEIETRVRQEAKAEYEVKLYRLEKLSEVKDEVIPELVTGTTKEEIDASVLVAKERYKAVANKVLGGVNIPPANTNTSRLNTETISLDELAKLDPRSPEYKEFRKKLGLK